MSLFVKFDVKLGDEGEVILEFLIAFLECFLDFNRYRVTHHRELVFRNVVDNCTIDNVVDYIAGELLAEAALQLAERNVAFAESGNNVGAAKLFELFSHLVFIIVFVNRYRQTHVYGRNLILCNFHLTY